MTRIAGSQSCYESPGCEIPWLSQTVDKSTRFCILQTCARVRVNRRGLSPFTSGRKSLCRLQHLKLKVMQALTFHTQSQISKLWEVWISPIMNFSTNLVLYNAVRVWEGLCNYECPMNGHLLWSWEFHIFWIWQDFEKCWNRLVKTIPYIESNFKSRTRFENIPKTIFNHFLNWVHECTTRPLGGLDEAFEGSVVQ